MFLLLLASAVCAEEKLPPRLVRVFGSADVTVAPDHAIVELGVEKQSASAAIAKHSADTSSHKILQLLREKGISEKDVQTTLVSLKPQFNYSRSMKLEYFVAEQRVSIRVRDLATLDKLVEQLIKVGANRVDSIDYDVSDDRKYRDQARELAVKAAREKAQALAKALGQEIGKAYSIEERPESPDEYLGASNVAYQYKNSAAGGSTTAAGQKTISASVIVSFELI